MMPNRKPSTREIWQSRVTVLPQANATYGEKVNEWQEAPTNATTPFLPAA